MALARYGRYDVVGPDIAQYAAVTPSSHQCESVDNKQTQESRHIEPVRYARDDTSVRGRRHDTVHSTTVSSPHAAYLSASYKFTSSHEVIKWSFLNPPPSFGRPTFHSSPGMVVPKQLQLGDNLRSRC